MPIRHVPHTVKPIRDLGKLILESKVQRFDHDILSRYAEMREVAEVALAMPTKKHHLKIIDVVVDGRKLCSPSPRELMALADDLKPIVEAFGPLWSKYPIKKGGEEVAFCLKISKGHLSFETGSLEQMAKHPAFIMVGVV